MGGDKCFLMIVGGPGLRQGKTESSMRPMSCSSMKCFKCDKKVHRFLNAKWQPHVDYLFVRNHNTNTQVLQSGLELHPGSASYACQCKFTTVAGLDEGLCGAM